MDILIVGLGLIGASFAKSLKKNTNHKILGYDISQEVLSLAYKDKCIDKVANKEDFKRADIILIALHPKETISFVLENIDYFSPKTIISDVCGVKVDIINNVEKPLLNKGVSYIGTHPMAGREFSSYKYSIDDLFKGASFIITKTKNTLDFDIEVIENLAKSIDFSKVIVMDPYEHDKIVAFTSQLAHIVSSAYIKSDTVKMKNLFSAGSFYDLTRVAKLNENMWTDLFLMNSDNLVNEIDSIINNLDEYKKAILDGDEKNLKTLLKEGRETKENLKQ